MITGAIKRSAHRDRGRRLALLARWQLGQFHSDRPTQRRDLALERSQSRLSSVTVHQRDERRIGQTHEVRRQSTLAHLLHQQRGGHQ